MVPDTLPASWTELVPEPVVVPVEPEPVVSALVVPEPVFVPVPVVVEPVRAPRSWDVTDVLCWVAVSGGALLSVALVVLVVVNWEHIWPFLVAAVVLLVALTVGGSSRPHCPGAWHK